MERGTHFTGLEEKMKSTVQIRIDGKTVEAPAGSTILDVAKQEGVHIPVLCYSPLLRPLENCRLCVVAVAGEQQYKAACSTPVAEGMDITTNNEELAQTRKLMLELLLDSHYGDCVAPCTVTCPANVDIQGYLAYIRKGEYRAAVELIKQKIPMPLSIGRVCPHPCESACRRHLVEDAINVNHCKRFVADYEMGLGNKVLPEVGPPSGKKVAIIGGGPAGLSLAYYLRTMGHGCTIFDAKDKLGGMLRYGIPEYRLPKATLDWEIDGIISLGVEVKLSTRWGKDFTLEDLKKQGFDAIFLGIGAWSSNKLGLEGEDLQGVLSGIEFLDEVASGNPPKLGKHVVVIGGGNTAIDAARTSLRLGVPKVTILYRRSRKEMPANPEEITAAEHEKVDIQLLAAPTKLMGDNGVLKQMEYLRMELGEPDASGRRRPVPVPGSETIIDVDQVVNAIGQFPTLLTAEQDSAMSTLKTTRWNTFAGDDRSQYTGEPMIFTGGDVFRGPMTVVAALADGRKAAYAMDAYFRTGEVKPEPMQFNISKGTLKTVDKEPFGVFKSAPRARMPELEVAKAVSSFDHVELGLSEEEARKEAERCLVCGCSAGFDCRLRDMMTAFDVKWRDQTEKKIHYQTMAAVDTNAEIVLDPNKCIRCQRCHVACATYQCSDAIDLKDYPTFITERCVECGLCVDLCPTGALLVKRDGRAVDRLDWDSVMTHCVNCGFGCELDLKVRGNRLIWIADGRQAAPSWASTCRRGRFRVYDDLWYGDRVSKPMVRQNGTLTEVSWEQAIEAVTNGFRGVFERSGAAALAAIGSPQASNESLYLLQKWMRTAYLTHGLDFPGRDAHERLVEKMEETIGFAGMTQELSGLDRVEAVFLCGDDLEDVSPVVATFIRRAVRQRQIPVFQIASKTDTLTAFATSAVQLSADQWTKAVQGILAAAVSAGSVVEGMLGKAGLKPAQLKDKLAATDIKAIASRCGIAAETLEKMAAALAKAGSVALVFPESLMESDATKECVTALLQLAALTGNLGSANAGGLYPLARDINTYGAALMGVSPNTLPGLIKITSSTARKNLAKVWHATKMPATVGTSPMAALDAQQIKGLFVQQSARFWETQPDLWRKRLSQVEFLVLQENVPSPAMEMAQVVLPMAAFGEQAGSVVNQERRLLGLQQGFAPCGEARADWEAVAQILAAHGLAAPKDLAELRQELSELVAGMTGFPWNEKLVSGEQLPWRKDSGTTCFDPATVKKMKLGL
jgi:formate dehydrogenase major subunit